MDPSIKYLDPEFDPSSLRVVDLRDLLNKYDIPWSSRHRKSDLIDIFKLELIPKLKHDMKEKDSHNEDNQIIEIKKENTSSENITTSDNSNKLIIQKNKNRNKLVIPKKRKIDESNDFKNNTDLNDEFSPNIKRNIKRKRNFSTLDKQLKKRKKKDIDLNDNINTGNIFNRNLEIKFNLPIENQKVNVDDDNKEHTMNDINTSNIPINSTHASTPIKEGKQNYLISNEINSFNEQSKIIDNNNLEEISSNKTNSVIDFNNQNFQSTPIKVKLENNLSGPTNKIKLIEDNNNINNITPIDTEQKLLTNDIKDKLNEIDSLNSKINDDLNQIEYNDNLNNQIITSQSFLSSNNITLDNDTAELTQLQSLFEIETSKIEIESEKVLNLINSKDKFIYYKSQFIKILIIWIILLLLSFIFAIYRQERIQVGFCDYEIRNNGSFLNKLFNLRLKCIKCPDHGICSSNSKLYCLPDYVIKYPIFWSFGGLIPTFNKCILDSTKIKKINKIIKFIIDLLSIRNANIKCGNGTDEEVGLNWNQIIEIINQKLLIDINDENYNYIWDKVKIILSTRTDLKFLSNKNDLMIRSISLSKLSIKCRLKRLILMILMKYKLYFLSILLILILLSLIFYKINLIQRKNHYYRNILKEIINKLQKQSNEYKKTKLGKPYIAKIQLRDYYLPQLQKLSKKNRNDIWKKIVKTVELNSNIKTDDIEINGDIMRVWSWCSDI